MPGRQLHGDSRHRPRYLANRKTNHWSPSRQRHRPRFYVRATHLWRRRTVMDWAMVTTSLPVDTHLAHVACGPGLSGSPWRHARKVRAGHEKTSPPSDQAPLLPVKAHLCHWRPCMTSPKRISTPCGISPFAVYLPESTHLRSLDTFTLQ